MNFKKAQTRMTDKSGSPPCGIYLRIEDFSNMLDVIGHIRKMAFTINRASGYQKNMSVVELVQTDDNQERVADLVQIVKDQGLVCLIGGKTNARDIMNADGLIIKPGENLQKIRDTLGEEAIIGVKASNKEEAKQFFESTLDLILLPADPSLLTWWRGYSQILTVADGEAIEPKNAVPLAAAEASFINASQYILNHPKGIMQATVNIMHAVQNALTGPKSLN